MPEPAAEEGAILVDGVALGICGTDAEIVRGDYGEAPPGAERLILGHESLGRVAEAPDGSGFAPGDLVVGIVRRPDPVPCPSCAAGEWDFCRNGGFTERGIKALHGYGSERWRIEPEFAIKLDPELGTLGVLMEPTTVVAKAWEQIDRVLARATLGPERVLVTGAGPIGLLAALLARRRGYELTVLDLAKSGPKPELVRELGGTYHSGPLTEVDPPAGHHRRGDRRQPGRARCDEPHARQRDRLPDRHLVGRARDRPRRGRPEPRASCWRTTSSSARSTPTGAITRRRRRPSRRPTTPGSSALITRRVPLDRWNEALKREENDIKVVVELGG